MLVVKRLACAYGQSQVLFDISFEVAAGEVVTLLGRNGMGKSTTISAVMGLLPALDGPRRNLVEFVEDRPGHDRRYALATGKIERELGWQPRESFESGLVKTIRWYLDNEAWVAEVTSGDYRQWLDLNYANRS